MYTHSGDIYEGNVLLNLTSKSDIQFFGVSVGIKE